ncbi:UNVERIFIED_CONTAM: Mitogen-activated protein kinase kinase kinase [Sesamum angustifolium]|uniref:Mitogen-activated protein kinase kinase kinase n=1 Tax=Sesamum angustifolium TaxID=2727405 RepID=A0AAW2QBK1_9LAMI
MAGKWRCSSRQPTEWLKGKVIGSGSFGTVHLAIDSSTGALFVVKSAISDAGITSLKNEASILENLDSPYIVECIGKDVSFAENGEIKYNLFMEYMAGGSLSDVAQNFGGALNEKLIRLYTREILEGLRYLHKNGIVHSDVKCKNVLLGASGAVKLADFGCAKRLNDNKVSSSKMSSQRYNGIGGTPLWMAPEVLRNEALNFAADIWSLGCTVIEMATGRPPWGLDATSKNPMAALLKIAKGHELPEFPRHFSAEGLDFLQKCLERDPEKRWTSEKLASHPFVTGKPTYTTVCSRKEVAFSPTSVLDVASYDSEYDDDSCSQDELVSRVPFSLKCYFMEQNFLLPKHASENQLDSSDNWITVRSR